MNALPVAPGFHIIRWTDDEDTHFSAMRVTWGNSHEEWQIIGDAAYFSKSEILDLIGDANAEVWKWDA